ncbi:hypothetical protein ACH24_01115 [Francisella persica ATCC VR-331]|uniref:Uncharacterized protein n=1 Tax=Francisella persica ATCC VR-331 TaxID=1086726 RepID=A0AAC8VD34_9GAMM|nr:hypothetical protein ACH24_01115 [Francisella persica ATCC VR-331]ANH77690.1 hypothetical protein FSC845_03925 [Francisella persica ATCC VR-331]
MPIRKPNTLAVYILLLIFCNLNASHKEASVNIQITDGKNYSNPSLEDLCKYFSLLYVIIYRKLYMLDL